MDPLTQGTLGAALPQATRHKKYVALAGGLGFLAGLAPDLDVLIRSETDPLLFLEYHRQFTHSFIFIPIGGLLVGALAHLVFRRWWPLSFLQAWMFCALGYATHGMLDAMTSYGTMLFWPFSETRYSFSIISIVDPLFTLPLLSMVILSAWRKRPHYARIGIVWVFAYLGFGLFQHQNAIQMGETLAQSRGHNPMRLEVKPSFANILVWKVIYEAEGRFYVDAVRASIGPKIFEGTSIAKLDMGRDLPWLTADSRQAQDVDRFTWFSDGYVALSPEFPDRVLDVRYSFLPNEITGLWSLGLDPNAQPDHHAQFLVHRNDARGNLGKLWRMVAGLNQPDTQAQPGG